MSDQQRPFHILMADDDAEDCLLFKDALNDTGLSHDVDFVANGEELLDRMRRREGQNAADLAPPDLILLDLNMPRMDGREVLRELKREDGRNDHTWRCPIVVLTTSTAQDDVAFCYRMGANSYITKPATYRQWVDLIGNLSKYWFEMVELPPS